MARGFLQIHITADALDECPNLEPVLTSTWLMSEWSLKSIKFLILSRRERVIEQHMDEISPYRIQCEREIVDADISLYVQNRLHTTLPFKRGCKCPYSPDPFISLRPACRFRRVECQLNAPRKCLKPSAVKKALSTLPKSLDGTSPHHNANRRII
ncbi:uncharacterized protein K441DRAFT_725738 [Cenococcum geophilum 1.58]|uniref:uncharacterized protein n=1 Tax=Cenococcum geophilum 1.58 TaxID=794803 RepID=UPI00358F79BE|nr:hypothetical protein K441DRAFT_725738 [Cenococcum geophilum 1.58]